MTHDFPDPAHPTAGLLQAAGGTWSLDPQHWRILWSEQARLIHEAPAAFTPTVWEALDLVDPADRPNVFAAALACVREGKPFELTAGITTLRGARRRVQLTGFPAQAASGLPSVKGLVAAVPGPAVTPEPRDTAALLAALREWEVFGHALPHEVRGPLAVVRGFAQVVEESQEPLSPRTRALLRRIGAAARHLESLFEGLQVFAPLAAREVALSTVDVSAIAHECVASLREADPQRQVDIGIEPGLQVRGDADLMRLVLCNLLGNAWKFTRDAGPQARIRLAGERNGSQQVLCVSDNGAGFDMADAAQLFSPFHRLHPQARFDGTGIGLVIVRRAVERMGGSVWAQSCPGEGASLFVAL